MATRFSGLISTHNREEYSGKRPTVLRQSSTDCAVQWHRGDVLLSTTGVVALDSGIMVNHPPRIANKTPPVPFSTSGGWLYPSPASRFETLVARGKCNIWLDQAMDQGGSIIDRACACRVALSISTELISTSRGAAEPPRGQKAAWRRGKPRICRGARKIYAPH